MLPVFPSGRSDASCSSASPSRKAVASTNALEDLLRSTPSSSTISLPESSVDVSLPLLPDARSSTVVPTFDEPSTTDLKDYVRQGRGASYAVTPRYREWILAKEREPDIRFVDSSMMGSSTMGQYFIGTNSIWINNAPQYAPYVGEVIRHEVGHYHYTDPTVSHTENEIRNRLYTYSVTRDSTQLAFGAYHP